jgi:hypothetical protein
VRLVCPYTPAGLRTETQVALQQLGRSVDMVDTSASDESYAELLAALWAGDDDFLLIEHDMIPTTAAVQAMEECADVWCANPYRVNHQVGEYIVGLGFTRFRAQLCRAVPDAVKRAGRLAGGYPARHWARVDARLAMVLDLAGQRPHHHANEIEHLHLV